MGEHGLTSAEAQRRLAHFGPNRIEERKQSLLLKAGRWFLSPIALMLLAAALLSLVISRAGDFYFILVLILLNLFVTLWHEHKADRAIEALRKRLSTTARVLRDGAWRDVSSEALVPGDYIECTVGDLVPADVTIREATNLELNESVVTGESLPKEKTIGEGAYSGTVVAAGLARADVEKTGNATYFGSIVNSAKRGNRRSTLERDIISISRYLMLLALAAVAALTAVLLFEPKSFVDVLLLDLSLLIAGLPVSLPTVMTLIINTGAMGLVKKQVLTRRLAALEDLANVDLLLTDKTGTLTESAIVVERAEAYAPLSEPDLVRLAAAASAENTRSIIDAAIADYGKKMGAELPGVIASIPGDSKRKRVTALLGDGERTLVSVGFPPIIASLISFAPGQRERFEADTAAAAGQGARVLAVAVKQNAANEKDESGMSLGGLLILSDPLRADAAGVVQFLESEGVDVKMVTGDTTATARRSAALLKLPGETRNCREDGGVATLSPEQFAGIGAFAEVLPEDKLALVRLARSAGRVVAVTGDGVNDLPAIKAADAGIAVANAVDALKGTADIVLLSHGIAVIRDALVESRKIFARLSSYATYRISESLRLIITVLVLGFLYADFPLTPVQLLLLAILNDVPIISLAFNRVKRSTHPANLKSKSRFILGSLFGLVGVANSLCLFFLFVDVWHMPWMVIQAAFFLKLAVSGHMLVYVAHTRERWWKYLPSAPVILATSLTQALATALVLFGLLVPQLSLPLIIFIWVWAFFWMQATELVKWLRQKIEQRAGAPAAEVA